MNGDTTGCEGGGELLGLQVAELVEGRVGAAALQELRLVGGGLAVAAEQQPRPAGRGGGQGGQDGGDIAADGVRGGGRDGSGHRAARVGAATVPARGLRGRGERWLADRHSTLSLRSL